MSETLAHPLDIPDFLRYQDDHPLAARFHKRPQPGAKPRAPFMSTVESTEVTKPKAKPAAKANGAAKPAKAAVKAADKPKAKAAGKAPAKAKTAPKATAKPAKATAKAVKPKGESTAKKDKWGFRDGSAKSKAVAMYAAKGGATLEEVKEAVGSVQLNVLKALEELGHEVIQKKEAREGKRAVTRYYLKAKKD